MEIRSIHCVDCKAILREADQKCPQCGKARVINECVIDGVVTYEWLKLRGKEPSKTGEAKIFIKQTVGPELYQDAGKLVDRVQVVDRRDKRYFKKITDRDTGEVIYLCDEPLPAHTGHGDAKRKRAKRTPRKPKRWRSYEEVAMFLIDQFKDCFGLERVEGKQKIEGESGAKWEIDGKGVKAGSNQGFVIVECRRDTTSGQKQGAVGGLAYTIMETGAAGGIIVSPLPLQKGARKVAKAKGIVEVRLNQDCTTVEYVMEFLKRVMLGVGVPMQTTAGFAAYGSVVRNGETIADDTNK